MSWRDSLRTKLMLWFGLLVGVLLLLGFVAAFLIARQLIIAGAQERTRYEAAQTAARLHASMESVRITGASMIGIFDNLALDREATIKTLQALLDADASTVGGLIALEPGVLPDGAPMAYYVGVERRGVADRDLIALGYNVAQQPWYRRTLSADKPWWSEPYFNETAGGHWMTTLNLPLRGRHGARLGMVSLDVPIARWSDLVQPLHRIRGQRPALFAPDGTIALHADPKAALKTTLDGYIAVAGRSDLQDMSAARAQGRRFAFTHVLPTTGETRYSVLEPIADTGWALQVSMSHKPLLAELKRTIVRLALIAVLALLLCALLVRRMAARITTPLSDLTGSASHFADGEFDYPLHQTDRRDEVGVMARAFDNARGSIKRQMVEIQDMSTARQKLESELDIAREIQLAMLPGARVLGTDGWRLQANARLEPAKAVGGDFYSFFERDSHTLWFAIGDVSDKGVPAALFMARTMTVLEIAAGLGGSPEIALKEAAQRLLEGNDTCMFATVLCGLIDARSGEFALASAGHEPPALLGADGSARFIELPSGPPLGVAVAEHYPIWRGRLRSGDALVAYTDGVTEAFDAEQRPFGNERLLASLRGTAEPGTLCGNLVADVHRFAAGAAQSDDITVLSLHWSGGGDDASGMRAALHFLAPQDRARLPDVFASVEAALAEAGVERERIGDVRLIVEEVMCNAIDYGGQSGGHEVSLELGIGRDRVDLLFRDDGRPFDPLAQAPPDLDADVQDRPLGGLGLYLIRSLADEAAYAREGRYNVLRIVLLRPDAGE
ncbi:SpoIIE family protein phosphatase [Lysobacter firmicutimachus]|uniref:SpoIIE family protein phosphatase n=1 Tax=Lysobacter firmicutimachus TaxID=1792846 RepID=A0AAU8MNC7_9GAMM